MWEGQGEYFCHWKFFFVGRMIYLTDIVSPGVVFFCAKWNMMCNCGHYHTALWNTWFWLVVWTVMVRYFSMMTIKGLSDICSLIRATLLVQFHVQMLTKGVYLRSKGGWVRQDPCDQQTVHYFMISNPVYVNCQYCRWPFKNILSHWLFPP